MRDLFAGQSPDASGETPLSTSWHADCFADRMGRDDDREDMQAETRVALSVADELSREEHQRKDEDGAQILAALRTTLRHIDLDLGAKGKVRPELVDGIHHLVLKMRHLKSASVRPRISALLFATEQLEDRLRGKPPRERLADRTRTGERLIAAGLGMTVLVGASSLVLRSRRRR